MVGNVACYVHILHADLTLGLEVDLGGQLNPDWSACSGPAGGCKARLPGTDQANQYRVCPSSGFKQHNKKYHSDTTSLKKRAKF